MDNSRLKKACAKAFSVTAACFIMSIVLVSSVYALFGWWIEPSMIVAMWILFAVIWLLTVIRMYIDGSRWALTKPYVIKNLIFMPLYLAVTMVFLVFVFGGFDLLTLAASAGAFLAVFTVMQVITYIRYKAATDSMNDALRQYQKEHPGDGQE